MRLSRADRVALGGLAGAGALAAAVAGGPRLLLDDATARARACLEGVTDARPHHATCAAAEAGLARLAPIPWVRYEATHRYEELRARMAVAAYDRATVDAPDPAARARASALLAAHEEIVEDGSRRLRLEALGAPIGAPDRGEAARLRGDRAALLDVWDHVGAWPVRLGALRAALQEGDLGKADVMAARYAEFDPRDADLRTAIGATLCLGPDPARGLEVLARVADDRAGQRHAAIARHWGEVRAVQEACADLAGTEPPPMPLDRGAGLPDAEEARAVLALRLAQGAAEIGDAVASAREFLAAAPGPSGAGLAPHVRHARAALLAELVVADARLDGATVEALARPRSPGEAPLALEATRGLGALLHEPPGDAPHVAATTFARASRRVEELAGHGDDARAATRLREIAAALGTHAAVGLGRDGDAAAAVAEARRAAVLAPRGSSGDLLLAASVAALADGVATARASSPASDDGVAHARHPLSAGGAGRASDTPAEAAALALVEALGAAARARGEDARGAVARAAAAASAGAVSPELAAEIAAWQIAFAPPPGDGEPRRAARRAAMARRGEAPRVLIPWTLALMRLAPEGASGDAVETWLDAAMAIDAPRFGMREVALARAIAARSRGDAENAERWSARLDALRGIMRDPRRGVAGRFLGL